MFYIALIHKEAGSAYGVSFPDLPGCVSAGDSFEDAALSAIEALGLHVEGMREDGEEIPAPSRYEEIMAASDAWWQCEGATFTAVPLIEDRARKVRVNINLNVDLLDAIDQRAKARGLTRSAFLASAATRELVGGAKSPPAQMGGGAVFIKKGPRAMTNRDTKKYQFKVGNKIVHGGITNDLERREAEHQQKWPSGHISQVGRATTEEAARAWEKKKGYTK